MVRFLRKPFPLRRACWFFTAFLLIVAPRKGWCAESKDGITHLERAWSHLQRGKLEPAAREAASAVTLLRGTGKSQSLAEALEALAIAELSLGRPAQALDHLNEGLTTCGACEERTWLRFFLTAAYRDLGRHDDARSLLTELLAEAEAAGSLENQGNALEAMAGIAILHGQWAEALHLLQESLRRIPITKRPVRHRGHILEAVGVLLSEAGDGAQALESLRQAEILYTTSDPSSLLQVRTNIAKAHAMLGQYDTALALFEEVAAASRLRGNQSELSRSLSGSAEILHARGHLAEAQRRFEESLVIERQIGRRGGETKALNHLAQIDLAHGRYDQAFSRLEESVSISRAGANRRLELTSLAASSEIYWNLRQGEEAAARSRRAGELGDDVALQDQAMKAASAAIQLIMAHRLPEALQQIDQALALVRQVGARPWEMLTLELRAGMLSVMGRTEEALLDSNAALALSRELGNRIEEMQITFLVGIILLSEHRYQEARASLEESLRIEREISGPRAITLWALGAVHELQWNSEAAISAYRESAEVSEASLQEIRADDLLAGLAENAKGSYGRWARLLAQQGDIEQAFSVAERGRAWAFLRRMGNPPPDPRKGADPALVREEEDLREKAQALLRQVSAEQNRLEAANIALKIDDARRQYETLRIRMQQANPEYDSLARPSPLTVRQVQKLLDKETTLIEYLLLNDEALAWVIDHDSVHLVRLTLNGEELADRVEDLRQRIAAGQPVGWTSFLLYLNLFKQLEPYLNGARIIVVPHGPLHALPFAALTPDAGKTWLAERYALSVLPSASVLPFLLTKQKTTGGGMLVLGDPDGSLPAAAAEARAVAGLYGSKALLGREATAAALRAAPRPIDRLHIAAHAVFDSARPMFSHLRLADGDLAAHDIFGLDLRGTQLVVLSGCQTGVGPATDIGELESLSRAFLFAGTPAVVATLWRVDDVASRALMEAFYRRLRAGAPAAESLRQAQIEILRSEEWSHPLFWAGFTLTGLPD